MDSLSRLSQISSSVTNEAIKKPIPAAAAIGALTLLGWGAVSMRSNFVEWKAMGPGGAPHNILGWIMQHALDLILGQDTSRLDYYDKPLNGISEKEKELVQRRFLQDLPQRQGPAAEALPFCLPQRQKLAGTEPEMLKAQKRALKEIAVANNSIIVVRLSGLEKTGQAIFVAEGIQSPAIASKTAGEICHIHDSDGSMHVALSNADGKEVLSKGWGERHRLSGTYMHLGYTMIYAPRDQEEVKIVEKLFKAGIAFMTEGKEVA